jgi:hypothetical protein
VLFQQRHWYAAPGEQQCEYGASRPAANDGASGVLNIENVFFVHIGGPGRFDRAIVPTRMYVRRAEAEHLYDDLASDGRQAPVRGVREPFVYSMIENYTGRSMINIGLEKQVGSDSGQLLSVRPPDILIRVQIPASNKKPAQIG